MSHDLHDRLHQSTALAPPHARHCDRIVAIIRIVMDGEKADLLVCGDGGEGSLAVSANNECGQRQQAQHVGCPHGANDSIESVELVHPAKIGNLRASVGDSFGTCADIVPRG